MNLIDIVKLNEEINKMIEKQDEEVKRINADIERKKETLYRAFMDDMEEYSKTAEAIGPTLKVSVGRHDNGYNGKENYYVRFDKRRHRLKIVYYSFWDEKWYFDHPHEFENNLKEECFRIIKDKAEKANKRMLDAEERKRSYESGETK